MSRRTFVFFPTTPCPLLAPTHCASITRPHRRKRDRWKQAAAERLRRQSLICTRSPTFTSHNNRLYTLALRALSINYALHRSKRYNAMKCCASHVQLKTSASNITDDIVRHRLHIACRCFDTSHSNFKAALLISGCINSAA